MMDNLSGTSQQFPIATPHWVAVDIPPEPTVYS